MQIAQRAILPVHVEGLSIAGACLYANYVRVRVRARGLSVMTIEQFYLVFDPLPGRPLVVTCYRERS